MTGGPAVPQSPSGRWSIALRRRHGRDANARRSAGACPAAWRETPRTGHQCRCPAACGFSAPVQTPADGASPTGSHSPAGGSGDMRTRPRRRTAGEPGGRSTHTGTTTAFRSPLPRLRACTGWAPLETCSLTAMASTERGRRREHRDADPHGPVRRRFGGPAREADDREGGSVLGRRAASGERPADQVGGEERYRDHGDQEVGESTQHRWRVSYVHELTQDDPELDQREDDRDHGDGRARDQDAGGRLRSGRSTGRSG